MLYLPMAKDPGQTMVRRRKGCFFILCLSGHFTWIEILSLTMVLCQSPWPYHTLHSHHALENTSIPLSPFTHLIFTAAAWIFLLVTQRSKTDLGTKIRDSYHWEVSEWHVDDAGNREVKGKSFILLQWLSLKWRNNLPHSPFLPSNTTFQNLNCLSPVFNCLKITRAAFALKKNEISLIKGKQQFSWGTYLPSAFQALNCPSSSLSQEPECIYNIGSVTVTEVWS